MLDFIPKPKSLVWRIINSILAITLIVLALFYLFSTFDFIPDGAPVIGFVDDIIIFILALYFVNKFVHRVKERWVHGKKTVMEIWRTKGFYGIVMDKSFWFGLIIIGLVVAYFLWSIELIPDSIGGIGYLDDAILAVAGAIQLIKHYHGGKSK